MYRSTKIVATIGPASQNEETINCLLKSGVNVARLNFSHGTHQDHAKVYACLRSVASRLGRTVSILQDLQGPKIRTGIIEGGSVEIQAGQPLTLTTQPNPGNARTVPIDFPQLLESVCPGNRILLDDGNLELAVESVHTDHVDCRVVLGGTLKSHKGVNLPGASLNIPGFTAKDADDLAFGLQLGVDYVAVSFVRQASDIEAVRQAITSSSPERYVPIIAKLERREALDNLEAILAVCDGVMVARGDLGVEMSPEAVPIAQKTIIEAANRHGKIVITATQMLDSMINNPRPTRAEASDVANAIFDGTDAVMLSGETASGHYPVQAVEMMGAIIQQAEEHISSWGRWQGKTTPENDCDDTYFITSAAHELAHDRNVAAIAVFSQSGRTALLMSKTRPSTPILAFTTKLETCQRMNLYWGVSPYLVPQADSLEEMVRVVEQTMIESSPINPGQRVALICGFPIPAIRPTNLVLLHEVGEPI
jgi:pyruvate kinase